MATVLRKIAEQLLSRTTFSNVAMDRARDAAVDTIGCMIAGRGDESVAALTRAFDGEIAGGGAARLVTGGSASPSFAALINATAAHALDFDDNFHPARAHASAVLVPALLAVLTSGKATSGRRFLEAYLAGLEAQAAVGFGVNPSHYNRGWHATATVGSIGAAAGVARLLGADEESLTAAMSLATSFACGPKGQFGTTAKPLHAGIAARNAVDAARMALAGMSGRADILERPQGFLDLFGGDNAKGWEDLTFEEEHIIESRGVVTKRHPCCASTHRAIDALLDLKQEHGLSAGDIARIETKVGISAARNLAYPDPTDEMQARFSMQYCLAIAFLKGSLSLSDFTRQEIGRPEIREFMPRIEMQSHSADEEKGVERLPHVVTVTMRDGRILNKSRLHAKGSLEAPMSAHEREVKFIDCLRWGNRNVSSASFLQLRRLADLENLSGDDPFWSKITGHQSS
ncbi:MmgE/PrpD family protein [Rhizobium leguminosarum]|uniref:MmgE/PrpD family protein n=1 Tax=Rhizobium leguminosarum TaxID=384 RepID=UPI0010302CB7|nr:MmgE/PrpD family protein [Rhizobium leguminosarum]TAV83677.1 MmgE/PrpD family protein [Rhizobium leguminosarum]TAV84254.1 MmgE/PrpD family protein [Rhizobium leguminosarum]TAW26689.1 MmgE/PrpD family protein [Rhizobium leguminosarum]TAX24549.1 MmgE/PrpD family protein [Rhizobium leguminosarum]TAX89996.1 MmgE/PrpD family protein [Rhizobium leguminosarum]